MVLSTYGHIVTISLGRFASPVGEAGHRRWTDGADHVAMSKVSVTRQARFRIPEGGL